MNIKAAILLGFRYLGTLKSKGDNHLKGTIIGIALSLIPLIVVIVVSNGMIEGITSRLIEVFTYHIQVTLPWAPDNMEPVLRELRNMEGIRNAYYEKSGYAMIKSDTGGSGTLVRCIPPSMLEEDDNLRANFNLQEGDFYIGDIPQFIKSEVFEDKFLKRLRQEEQAAFLESSYEKGEAGYTLGQELDSRSLFELEKIVASLKFSTVIIGKALAERLKVDVGDQIFLLSAKGSGSLRIARSSKFIVSGIFSTGYQDIDKFLLYISFDKGEKILADENSRQYIGLKVADPYNITRNQIAEVKRVLKKGGISYGDAQTWLEKQKNRFESYRMTKVLLILIIGLIMLVASVNVSSSMVMLVMGKNREIAILKSMGAKPATISLTFLFTGFCTGLLGTLCGLIPGLFLAVNINEIMILIEKGINIFLGFIYRLFSHIINIEGIKPVKILNPDFYLEKIPINISFWEVFGVACFSLLVTTAASYIPARKAGEIKPLEIIRRY